MNDRRLDDDVCCLHQNVSTISVIARCERMRDTYRFIKGPVLDSLESRYVFRVRDERAVGADGTCTPFLSLAELRNYHWLVVAVLDSVAEVDNLKMQKFATIKANIYGASLTSTTRTPRRHNCSLPSSLFLILSSYADVSYTHILTLTRPTADDPTCDMARLMRLFGSTYKAQHRLPSQGRRRGVSAARGEARHPESQYHSCLRVRAGTMDGSDGGHIALPAFMQALLS
ncbi:hypothetical protein EDB89DRAFT_436798 [Lactarius sanguifluus]|nr:hypothetical protein EDB89DRAFT_436798 [Lactarius sanguifluus]